MREVQDDSDLDAVAELAHLFYGLHRSVMPRYDKNLFQKHLTSGDDRGRMDMHLDNRTALLTPQGKLD